MTNPEPAHPRGRDTLPTPAASVFLQGGGEMAALIRAKNWADTPLGPPEAWPRSLETALRILVTSRYAMWLGWGPGLIFFYNDAYGAMSLGAKHPWALGRPASEVWQEIWPDLGPRAESVLQSGAATWDEGLLLFLQRSGFPEETYHTFSYSPLPDDQGQVGGLLCVVTEDTERVIGERRLATLRELAAELSAVRTEPDVCAAIERGLGFNERDLPFSVTWLFDPEGGDARLACATGIAADHPMVSRLFEAATMPGGDPSRRNPAGGRQTENLTGYDNLPTGAWDVPPREAVAVPIVQQGEIHPSGVLLAALNPYRPQSDGYRGFLDLVASQIASGLASSRAYEAERQRAEALSEIDRAKTAFFSNVSHEFRTPLTLMLGPLEEEIATRDDESAGRLMMAQRNGLRLLRLVNTLLDFSRIEAGRVRAAFRPTELAAYTAELASNFRSACERAGVRLTVDCPPLPQPVYVDADMWERVVLNLMSNAFKYTLDGEIVVRVVTIADGSGAELIVSDTGVGIPAVELPRIFDRFHRIEGQTGRTVEGTGIGLALVNELVRLHGGTITVGSEVGVGTTVRVVLPFGHAHLAREYVSETLGRTAPEGIATATFVEEALRWLPERDKADAGADSPEPANALPIRRIDLSLDGGTRPSILLADDNPDMRDYVVRLLSGQYDVVAVSDGAAALAAAQRQRPDLVLSDVMMPRLDGFGLLKAIRADPALRGLPVILLSARAGDEARVEGLDAGADDYLVKPFAARELLARVRSNLELAGLRREAEETLRRINETLEQRVAAEIAERARAEETLRQAQKMEAVGQLTGGVAHDFNNLLTVIGGGVETLQRLLPRGQLGDNEDRIRRAIGMIAQGADRAATLTHRLLAFARRQSLDPQPIDANRLVVGMSELLRRTLGEQIAIETIMPGSLWCAVADPNQLENALLNLAVNARDAMPQGGRLTIRTGNVQLDATTVTENDEVTPGPYVMIAVADTGVGMAPETIKRVFEPFFTTKDVGHGTGLGLSQVYGFIKQSRGHVQVESTLGQGTVVTLYLPRLQASEKVPEPTDATAAPPPQSTGETVLLVEDDDAVRAHAFEVLRDLGYCVLVAADGATALETLRGNPDVRLLFTDVGLPGGMTGRQLAEAAHGLRPELPVLFSTGYAGVAVLHDGRWEPGTHLLEKPFTYAELGAKVRAALGG